MEDKIVAVKYYETVIEAEVDMNVLDANNIQCTLNPDTMVGLYPIFNDKERGMKLMVFEADLEKAVQLLESYHASAITE